jgi:hypothetical protein
VPLVARHCLWTQKFPAAQRDRHLDHGTHPGARSIPAGRTCRETGAAPAAAAVVGSKTGVSCTAERARAEIHAESGVSAFEAHGIAASHGSGPYKIVNNRIEASHINLFLGGTVPALNGVMPSDLEIRHNHLIKPLSWRPDDPSFAGTTWGVKHLFELVGT